MDVVSTAGPGARFPKLDQNLDQGLPPAAARRRSPRFAPYWRALLAALCLCCSGLAAAQTYQPFAKRYDTTLRGRLVMLANANLTCATPTNGVCGNPNDRVAMGQTKLAVDAANPAITNSSSSDLTPDQLPAGATVVRAILYWGSLVGDSAGAPQPNPAATPIQFATAGGGYQTLMAQSCATSRTLTLFGAPSPHQLYKCHADVTARVAAAGVGTYRVANLPLQTGDNRFGGWSMVVVIADPAQPLRNFTVHDGLALISSTAANPQRSISIGIDGFTTPPTGPVTARLGLVGLDGDQGAVDGFTFQGQGSSTIDVSDACESANPRDVFNSSICYLGSRVTTRSTVNGNLGNTLGFDADIIQLPNAGNSALRNGATSATVTATTTSEGYAPIVLTTSIEVNEPGIEQGGLKTQANLTHPNLPAGQALPGDQIRYTVAINNTGRDNLVDVVLDDALPAGTNYVPGSLEILSGANPGVKSDAAGDDQAERTASGVRFRVGAGANALNGGRMRCTTCTGTAPTAVTIAFTVQVPSTAATGSVIRNAATLAYRGESSGQAGSVQTNQTTLNVIGASLRLNKSISARGVATDQFTIAINNGGPSATTTGNATTATTGVFAAQPGTAYTLSETGAGTPAANLGNYAVTYSCLNSSSGGTQVPAGTTTSFQVTPAAGDDLVCTFTNTPMPRADLSVTKSNRVDSVVSGSETTYDIVVSNAGPAGANGATVRDPAPQRAGLDACALATPACEAAGGAACPAPGSAAGQLSIANLEGAGVAIPALPVNGTVTLRIRCAVQ